MLMVGGTMPIKDKELYSNMRILDLFCCDGGASMGLHQSGFSDITGVDIDPHPNYPFKFIQSDVFSLSLDFLKSFDFIWASPPCQLFSPATNKMSKETNQLYKKEKYINLIPQTRKLLEIVGVPFVIENVPNAPIRKDLMLCGTMFGIPTFRHRHFEISGFSCNQPDHKKHTITHLNGEVFTVCGTSLFIPGISGGKERRRIARIAAKKKVEEVGGIKNLYQQVMGIYHTDIIANISEAVPPCYSKYIGEQFLKSMGDIHSDSR